MDFHVVVGGVARRLSLSNFFMHVFFVAVVFFLHITSKTPNSRMFVGSECKSADMMTRDIAQPCAPTDRRQSVTDPW